MMSVRGLVRAIFDEQQQRPVTPSPRARRKQHQETRVRSWNVSESDSEATYVPQRLEGEYNVCFRRKPLGLGLVPSTQLYGSWEVSSVQETAGDDAPLVVKDGDVKDKQVLEKGDVVIAVNFSRRKAQLPRARLAAYLRQCTCPIVVTLRNPQVYGSLDSRALSTAMYPDSLDSRQVFSHKVVARASSKQWRRSLEHDLAWNAQEAKDEGARKLAQALVSRDADKVQNAPAAGIADVLEWKELSSAMVVKKVDSDGKELAGPTLSPLGEFEVTFNETPLHMALAPSTRLYGSVEVYDPKHHAPTVQVGDVIMAVNGYSSVTRLSSDDVIDAIVDLQAPVMLRFRRPVAYRNYLASFFHTKRELSSQSIASAMFPPSAEYKKKTMKPAVKKISKTGSPVAQSFIDTTNTFPPEKPSAAGGDPNEERLRELKAFAAKIGSMDQFKLWSGGDSPKVGGRPVTGHQSAFLTEKHVQFLWKHLPNYLTCNQMELIFTTRVHGWNLLSFFSRLENKGPTILVVQDEHDSIFGAFCPASWKRSRTVFGNGRTFVFSLSPRMNAYMWSGIDSSYMYTRRDAIFVGGGSKGIALCLQLDDRRGFSHACTTFDSPPLVDYDSFRCETIEVWGFHGLKI